MCTVQLIKLCDHTLLLAAAAELKLQANISFAAIIAAVAVAAAAMLQVVVAVQSVAGERSCTVLL
jgi:negative regulator of sigma E activity